MPDPRDAVVVGVGQVQRRPTGSLADLPSPIDMMVEALRIAREDSGAEGALLRRADSIRAVDMLSFRYTDPAALVAERLGATPRERVKSTVGGNSPQMLVNDAALAIRRGEIDVVLICGAESMYSRMQARKREERLTFETQPQSAQPTRLMGTDRPGSHDAELARGIAMPTQVYPIFECALRAAAGETVDEHRLRIAELWSRFSEVAATNPAAWSPEAVRASDIAEPSPDNRMVGFPYTKLMNANIQVDQAAAVVVCSVAAAQEVGIPEDKWVYVWAGADASDHWFVSERSDLSSSPAIAACGRTVFELAGVGVDDLAHVDLYSCFPSAVQVGAAAIGLDAWDPDRVPTVTGGLTFAGGPGNNYVTHSIATMVDLLRRDPGTLGLVTALGWYITKHSMAIYSTRPPKGGFKWESPQASVDALPRRDVVVDHDGPATIEAYTVMHARDGSPEVGLIACLTDDGARTWANTNDDALMKAMLTDDLVGHPAVLQPGGKIDLA